jgi:ArsR family metal-binding transcriptional regulator
LLLKNYRLEIFRPECNASFQSLHCHAHLEEDIGEVIPYLNAVLGGTGFTQFPPSVMFRVHGRLIAVHPRKVSINALRDAEEAEKVVEWLKREINEAWEKRHEITPEYGIAKKPQPMEVLKLLPKTNCRECGQPTCLVFSALIVQGAKGPADCPALDGEQKRLLSEYLDQFKFCEF